MSCHCDCKKEKWKYSSSVE